MATGPEHYEAAENMLAVAAHWHNRYQDDAHEGYLHAAQLLIGQAQIHATLALTAATAELDAAEGPNGGSATGRTAEDSNAWRHALKGDEAVTT